MPTENPEVQAAVDAALATDRERVCELLQLLACPDGATRARVHTYIRNGKSRAEFTEQFGTETR